MTALHDLLDELATSSDQALTRPPMPAPDLWRRGRRVARIRRAAGGVATVAWALVACVVGFSLWGVVPPSLPSPADAERTVLLPTSLHTPSRWLPGTAGHPIGPLVALVPAPRGWRGGNGLAGVSGVTGEYRFLDLPDRAEGMVMGNANAARPALSPGGRYVAYWLAGEPAGAPWSLDEAVITGVAVYDTVAGTVLRQPIATQHGLFPWGLAWLDDDRLFFWAGEHHTPVGDGSSAASLADGDWGTVWTISTDSRQRVDGTALSTYSLDSVTADGQIVFTRAEDDTVRVADPSTHPLRVRAIPVPANSGTVFLSPGLATGAVIGFPPEGCCVVVSGAPGGPVGVFAVGTTPDPSMQTVPGFRTTQGVTTILSMPDDHYVVLSHKDGADRFVLRLDVRTGEQRVLTWYPTHYQYGEITFAVDALARDPVDRPAPPRPWDPRVTWSLVAGVAVLGAVAVVVWRRRVRP